MEHGVRLVVTYDGTDFCGFQGQTGQRTVQGVLAEAASRVAHHPVTVWGASRTDSGVHAEGQVVAFATHRELTPRRWVMALNRYLPDDVSVARADPCAPDYRPRFDAREKTYRYLFQLSVVRDALLARRSWHLGSQVRYELPDRDRLDGGVARLDLAAMRALAEALTGTHDFRAFRAAGDTRETTERTLSRVALVEDHGGDPRLLALEVTGNAFMRNMVRILAGTFIDVGRGRLDVPRVQALLGPEGDRRQAGVTAPPQGLTLVSIRLGRLHGAEGRSAR